MHLDHRIPWNALAAHLSLSKSQKSSIYHRSDLFWNKGVGKDAEAERALITKTRDYFTRAFISTTRDFGATKSAKDVKEASPPESLFSEDLIKLAETR